MGTDNAVLLAGNTKPASNTCDSAQHYAPTYFVAWQEIVPEMLSRIRGLLLKMEN